MDFLNHRKNYKSSILGLYGQNGSGKTALIEALQILKSLLCGEAVPECFGDCINVEAEHAVISPGGSVVYCEEAMKHYKEIGTIVYLHASFEVINSRLKNAKKRGVALRDGQTLKDLYDERVVLFEKYADITVSEDGLELEETIENVMEILENQ